MTLLRRVHIVVESTRISQEDLVKICHQAASWILTEGHDRFDYDPEVLVVDDIEPEEVSEEA